MWTRYYKAAVAHRPGAMTLPPPGTHLPISSGGDHSSSSHMIILCNGVGGRGGHCLLNCSRRPEQPGLMARAQGRERGWWSQPRMRLTMHVCRAAPFSGAVSWPEPPPPSATHQLLVLWCGNGKHVRLVPHGLPCLLPYFCQPTLAVTHIDPVACGWGGEGMGRELWAGRISQIVSNGVHDAYGIVPLSWAC